MLFFFVTNHRSFLMLIDVSSAGRGREVVSSLRDERSGQVAGGTEVPGRSNEAASGKQEAVAAAVRCIRNIVA